jgi:transcriptional regulator
MVIKGLKALIKKTSRGKLVRSKAYTCFRAVTPNGRPHGAKLKGVSKRLHELIYSSHELPMASSSHRFTGWKGLGGGLRRGKAVDAQVSRLSKASATKRKFSKMLKLTRLCFEALAFHDLEPIEAQRVVLDEWRGVATAVDIVCQRGDNELVLVELKCGYDGDRSLPVRNTNGRIVKLKAPLKTATDCALHRHLAQLAATFALFVAEEGTQQALQRKGVTTVSGALLYVDDERSELHTLPEWWKKRGERLLNSIM